MVKCMHFMYAVGLVAQSCPTLCYTMDCSPPGSSVLGNSPGKNTRVGCYALPQGIFPTQGSNPGLSHCRWMDSLPSEPPGKPHSIVFHIFSQIILVENSIFIKIFNLNFG